VLNNLSICQHSDGPDQQLQTEQSQAERNLLSELKKVETLLHELKIQQAQIALQPSQN
jgi:hypothetical protein